MAELSERERLEAKLAIKSASIQKNIRRNPWVSIGGVVVAGVVVGLLIGKKRKTPARDQRIRIDKIKEDAVCEIDAGAPTEGVIEKALYRHLSEIGDGKAKEKSAVSELVGTAFKTALISAFKKATPLLIATLVDGLKNNLNESEEDASSE